jgi:hypothetical protein
MELGKIIKRIFNFNLLGRHIFTKISLLFLNQTLNKIKKNAYSNTIIYIFFAKPKLQEPFSVSKITGPYCAFTWAWEM